MLIFDRRPCSLAAVTPAKYEHDIQKVISVFILMKTGEMNKREIFCLFTPTPWYAYRIWLTELGYDCCLFGAHLLSEPMLIYCQLNNWKETLFKPLFKQETKFSNCIWKFNVDHFCSSLLVLTEEIT